VYWKCCTLGDDSGHIQSIKNRSRAGVVSIDGEITEHAVCNCVDIHLAMIIQIE